MARTALAPAKLNLSLHITGKREDGYHLLESLVVFTDMADMLTVEPAQLLSLTVSGPFAPESGAVDDNLTLRAARLLQAHTGCCLGAALHLQKHVPVGAGLGGGSADAAAALRLLNDLWALHLDDAVLHRLAPQLGADVAMFLHGQAVLAQGIGELLTPVALPTLHAVLVYPNKALRTPQVYGYYEGPHRAAGLHENLPAEALVPWLKAHTHNDLQRPAIQALPEVAEVLLALETALPAPALVRMTGSGACCFALYGSPEDAGRAAAQLAQRYPHWWVRAVRAR